MLLHLGDFYGRDFIPGGMQIPLREWPALTAVRSMGTKAAVNCRQLSSGRTTASGESTGASAGCSNQSLAHLYKWVLAGWRAWGRREVRTNTCTRSDP
jgi:hypothetical protein